MILLVQVTVTIIIIALVLNADPTDINEPTVRGAILTVGIETILYAINRLGFTSIPVLMHFLMLVALFIYIPFYSGENPAFLAFLMIPIIIIAIFFSIQRTILASIILLVLVGILLSFMDHSPQNLPYWDLRNMWYFLMLATGLIVTFMWHLRTLEQVRQEELVRINKELERDIALRIQAENALRQSEERYRGAITAAGLVPYVIDYNQKRFTFIGEDILKLTGYSPQEIRPTILREQIQEEYIWGSNAALTPEEARPMFLSGKLREWRSDMRILTRNGESRWLSDASIKIADDEGKAGGAIGIFQDITRRKQTEVEHQRLIKELERRNAELERFAYTVSHELKSPVITMKGYLGSIELDLKDMKYERAQSDLHRISSAADKMLATLSDLLELSRVGLVISPPEEIDLDQLTHDALQTISARIESKNVNVKILPNLPTVWGDRLRLREVFENLIDNAIKYSREVSPIEIEVGVRDQAGEPVLFVKDNGIGIDPKYHSRIFGLFEKLDATSEGTGVGLALVKRIVELHGGKIWVESDGLGKGSTFWFTLPDRPSSGEPVNI